MNKKSHQLGLMSAACSLVALMAVGGVISAAAPAHAADAKAPDAPELEVVVVTAPRGTAAAVAPTKASLDAIEPQSIVARTFIEDSVADTSDYTGIVAITPSTSGGVSSNGPGLSEKDVTLRGFGDGESNVTYDDIPFGDTNDPTHHSTAYFPASTIGAVQVERGPGGAGNLGQATFGGSINLYSRTLTDDAYAQQKATYGSWNTRNFVTTLQSGELSKLGLHGVRATANFQELFSDGALSYAGVKQYNQFFKVEAPLGSNLTLTLLATHNEGHIYQPDNDGITLAQEAKYGKDFSMSNDPSAPTYYKYNTVDKETDFEYGRLKGQFDHGFSFENTLYTYGYTNDTISAADTTQNAYEIANGIYPGWGTKAAPKGNHDVVGYDKLNSYRVIGDIVRFTQDFSFGQARAGLWYEWSSTDRHRFDLDRTLGVPDPREKPPATGPIPAADIQFLEYSNWTQYQPFLDVDFRPMDNLTITPGVKYIHFERKIDSPVTSKTRIVDQVESATFTKTLPFASVNWKIAPNWAAYAQYAQGFLVPPLKVFYVPSATSHPGLKPQQSTNYQIGTVFNSDKLTVDGDVYYIEFTDKFGKVGSKSDPFYTNLPGTVIYKGVEGEATYALAEGVAVFANGSLNSAKDDAGQQIANAPEWTAAMGVIFKHDRITASLISKFTGQQWANDGEPAGYKIKAYNTTNLIVGYDFGRIKLQGGVYNLFDSRNVTDISVNDGPFDPANPTSTGHDQYWWQPERSYQLTLRATL